MLVEYRFPSGQVLVQRRQACRPYRGDHLPERRADGHVALYVVIDVALPPFLPDRKYGYYNLTDAAQEVWVATIRPLLEEESLDME